MILPLACVKENEKVVELLSGPKSGRGYSTMVSLSSSSIFNEIARSVL